MTEKFPVFAAAIHKRFTEMSLGELLIVDSPDIFAVYLAAFPEGTNPIFRTRTEHDGSIDKHFIRNLGRCVQIRAGAIHTVWDVPTPLPYPYDVVAQAMSAHVQSLAISGVFRTKERSYGTEKNVALLTDMVPHIDMLGNGLTITQALPVQRTHTFHHFHGVVSPRHFSAKPDEARGAIDTTVHVFKRGLDELTTNAFDTVLELIDTNSLYRGAEFRKAVAEFRELLHGYRALNSDAARSLFAWSFFDSPAARFRNTAIGTLVTDLSDGVDLDRAVRGFESKVAPTNYKRTTALITPRMIEQAVATLQQLGLENAVERRFANLSDISVNNVLFVDRSAAPSMKDGIAGLLASEVKVASVKVDNAEPIGIDAFMRDVVPRAASISLVAGNEHLSNFVSLTAPVHADAGRLFKWPNGFAWSYDGDAADSIKERVKRAGGKVDAEVRVSLSWHDSDDLDLHVHGPSRSHIYFGNKTCWHTGGELDVDMNANAVVPDPVENIFWSKKMPDGSYAVVVNNYRQRLGKREGFSVEMEAHGKSMTFGYDRAVPQHCTIPVLDFRVSGGRVVDVVPASGMISGSGSTKSQEKWGVSTNVPQPVDVLLASPNHWDGHEIGNKHWFFVLKGCKNPEPARGIYNEFLRGDLDKHRKVFEVLGSKTKCPVTDDQLSGVGFSSTRQDKVTVVVRGKINRAFQISF